LGIFEPAIEVKAVFHGPKLQVIEHLGERVVWVVAHGLQALEEGVEDLIPVPGHDALQDDGARIPHALGLIDLGR
jgi:hypothetical protein